MDSLWPSTSSIESIDRSISVSPLRLSWISTGNPESETEMNEQTRSSDHLLNFVDHNSSFGTSFAEANQKIVIDKSINDPVGSVSSDVLDICSSTESVLSSSISPSAVVLSSSQLHSGIGMNMSCHRRKHGPCPISKSRGRRRISAICSSILSSQTILTLLCLAVILTGTTAQSDSGVFIKQPNVQPYYRNVGDENTVLLCSAREMYAKEPYEMSWTKVTSQGPSTISLGDNNRMRSLYELDQSGAVGTYNLKIRKVSFESDNGRFYCQVKEFDIAKQYNAQEAHVIVLVRPQPPVIKEQSELPIKQGAFATAVCESRSGNPPPTINWFFSNNSIIPSQYVTVTNGSIGRDTPTVSRAQWPVTPDQDGTSVSCKVWNEAMGSEEPPMQVDSKIYRVLYQPMVTVRPKNFNTVVDMYNYEEGSVVGLQCTARGNPSNFQYSWQQLETTRNPAFIHNTANVSISLEKSHRGRYECTVLNAEGSGKSDINIAVVYGPKITVQEVLTVKEGGNLDLECDVDANPPAVKVSWEGPGGSAESYKLPLRNVRKEHAGNYTCTAQNILKLYDDPKNQPRLARKTTQVKVLYNPGKAVITQEEETVIVGSAVTLKCAADDPGYPAAYYRWKGPGMVEYMYNPMATFTITNVQLTHAGEYWCLPENKLGKTVGQGTEASHVLKVREPASLDVPLKPLGAEITAGESGVSLACVGKGNPAPQIRWYKDGEPLFDLDSGKSRYPDHWDLMESSETHNCAEPLRCSFKVKGTLQWRGAVRWSDKGEYRCVAVNIAGAQNSNHTMQVIHKPEIDAHPSRVKFAADIGGSAILECRTSAMPEPSFRWKFKGMEVEVGAGKYSQDIERDVLTDTYIGKLSIRGVTEEDLGNYMCTARNWKGEDSQTYELQRKTKPEMPTKLQKIEATHNSLRIAWEPGFNGGYAQTFKLMMVPLQPLSNEPIVGEAREYEVTDRSNSGNRFQRSIIRWKRFVTGFNSAVIYEIPDLQPMRSYQFQVSSNNERGTTSSQQKLIATTKDAPENPNEPRVMKAIYNSDEGSINFKPPLKLAQYCLLVYVQRPADKEWRTAGCFSTDDDKIGRLPSNAEAVKVKFCLKHTMECSVPTEAMSGTLPEAGVPWGVVGPIIGVALFLLIVAIIVGVCCFCCGKGKTPKTKRKGKKDYEMETNTARPKTISGPILNTTEKMPVGHDPESTAQNGTPQHISGSATADSGVFTTLGSQYDYGRPGYGMINGGGNGYTNGAMRQSYEEGADRWGNAADPFGDIGDPYGNGMGYGNQPGADFGDMGYSSQPDMGYGGYYDPYGNPNGMVDLNPGGTMHPDGSHEGSVNSGYSTPNQRRVIREIIV